MDKRKIELGSTVRDVVSGFTGVAIARAEHIHLCDRYSVQPMVGKDGKPNTPFWIDGHALVVVAKPSKELKDSIAVMAQRNASEETPKVGGSMEACDF